MDSAIGLWFGGGVDVPGRSRPWRGAASTSPKTDHLYVTADLPGFEGGSKDGSGPRAKAYESNTFPSKAPEEGSGGWWLRQSRTSPAADESQRQWPCRRQRQPVPRKTAPLIRTAKRQVPTCSAPFQRRTEPLGARSERANRRTFRARKAGMAGTEGGNPDSRRRKFLRDSMELVQ